MKDLPEAWSGETYYGQPPLKNPQWDWKVSGYIAVAGTAGASQALAWIGSLRDRAAFRGVRRNANLLGLAGMATGSALLIADLKTPRRFYNMLRIVRPTSPMSFGTYILGVFGGFSSASFLANLAANPGPVLRSAAGVVEAGAAVSGAGAATYTAALMSATSNPYWAAAPRSLGAQFATSAVASGAAALAVGERLSGRRHTAERLEAVAAVATAAHLVAGQVAKRARHRAGVEEPVEDRSSRYETADLLLAGAAPLAGYALNRATGGRAPGLAITGSLALIAGSFAMRHGILDAGKSAARRPEAAFSLAQPGNLPDRQRRRVERQP
ncbi:Formate-dependent nitrite reductase, membrane component NrfD [Palleronia marisminoris]|uniref:NrfD/PsrC family molybdoenzyme membrane anchor subunit n=1 Tax=Palleronia marisminoris TaxID=315423 RepID=UPI0008ED8AF0|nr:NrfD/PsrC family molybdoenzyme membrane anchor subunit [Palleronia marisminoris]SFH26678.1 Formate-dependent nitrite reductase, membrane component NrfD [Palleronia marisminoris]